MLHPFLVVGVGGSGGKTLRAVRQTLLRQLQQAHWADGWPDAWQFLHVDTPTAQDGLEFPAPLLEREDYISLVPSGLNYAAIYNSLKTRIDKDEIFDVEKPLPSPKEVTVAVEKGAGAYRAVGRAISVASLDQVYARTKLALTKMQNNSAQAGLAALARHLGIEVNGSPSPTILIVSSIAGGSGAGMFIDVTEAVKSATSNATWADQSFSILYAPDVFNEVNNQDNISPNALSAIAETMSGYWNNSPSKSTLALYKSHGLVTGSNAEYRIGPAFNFIVGRDNGTVSFESQAGVYKAVATSIATWMTDDKIQDSISAYSVANFTSKATSLTDNSQLKRANLDAPPFSSMGFARVSLGTDTFFEYSSERMAKQVLKTLFEKHLEQDPGLNEKTREQWVTHFADLAFPGFLEDSGLNELTENNNQVIEAIQPDLTELRSKLKNAIQSAMNPKGESFDNWVAKITNQYQVHLPGLLDELSQLRNSKIREWVEEMPQSILSLVLQTTARQGLPVTVELISRLLEQVRRAADELLEERSRHIADASNITTSVAGKLHEVSTMNLIPPSNPNVAKAIYEAETAFHWQAIAELKLAAAELLKDFAENYMAPLQQAISSAASTLQSRANDPKLIDQRENPYGSWPDFKSAEVPRKFAPAPNEAQLIDFKYFNKIFDELIVKTISDDKLDAHRVVIEELVMGALGFEMLKPLRDAEKWQIVSVSQAWVPQNRVFQVRQAASGAARFDFVVDHMEFVSMAEKWLNVPGRAFSAYLDQTIASFLHETPNKAVESENHSAFIKAFQTAVASADPLVKINKALLGTVHGPGADEKSVVFSTMPVDPGHSLFTAMKDVLVANGYWDDKVEGKFVGRTGAPNARHIDIFTQTGYPLQPIVMGSVMDPIVSKWVSSSNRAVSRGNFLKWRRGRTLAEAIPAAPAIWKQMLRGWYVARLLGQLGEDRKHQSYSELGPKVWIFGDSAHLEETFPFPLMYPDSAPTKDLPGVVLESLTVALANCYAESSLRPLAPYHRLLKLGGSEKQGSDELSEWVIRGELLDPSAPKPNGDRAGMISDSVDARKEKCLKFLEDEKSKFIEYVKVDKFADPREYPTSWEIREDILRAIDEVKSAVNSAQVEDEL